LINNPKKNEKIVTPILNSIDNIKSVLLIDNNEIDRFINYKMLELYGITKIISFKNANDALLYLKDKSVKCQLILIDIYLPVIDGFEFIDKFNKLSLDKKHGKICILSASLNPSDKKKAEEKNIRFIEKPLIIDELMKN